MTVNRLVLIASICMLLTGVAVYAVTGAPAPPGIPASGTPSIAQDSPPLSDIAGSPAFRAASAAAPTGQSPALDRVRIQPPVGISRAIARARAALDAPEVGRVPAGEDVEVLETTNDGRWFRIRHPALIDQNGWIHRDVLTRTGSESSQGPSRSRARPVSDPPGGCELNGITYDAQGKVWGCGGGNWCANSPPLVGGCPR
jgi:hypothetical protein